MTLPALPAGYTWRRPARSDAGAGARVDAALVGRADAGGDAAAVARLLAAAEQADMGVTLTGEDDVLGLWARPGFDHGRDAWLVESATGDLVAYASLYWPKPGHYCELTVGVHPGHRRRGLGAALLGCTERRAREAAAEDATAGISKPDVALAGIYVERGVAGAAECLMRRGYRAGTVYLDMAADLREPPATPRLPSAVEIRPLRRGIDEKASFDCADEAFAEHHFVEVEDYDEWLRRTDVRRLLDTRFWLLAWHDDMVVGDALVYPGPESPYIYELAVRPSWRGRGLGRALMLALLGALRDAGHPSAWLRVDEHNHTGATQVYRGLGMHAVRTWDFFEKPLGA